MSARDSSGFSNSGAGAWPAWVFLLALFILDCSAGRSAPPPRKYYSDITERGGCMHHSGTACIEYDHQVYPGHEVRRNCKQRDQETFIPGGCPAGNRLGRCDVRQKMTIFLYKKISPSGAAGICRNSFKGRWKPL